MQFGDSWIVNYSHVQIICNYIIVQILVLIHIYDVRVHLKFIVALQ